MAITPESSIVSAASKPLAAEHVWHTCCFAFIFCALPLQGLQVLFPHHFPAGSFEPVNCSSSLLQIPRQRFHSWTKWIPQLSGAVHSTFQGRGTFLSGTGFTAVFLPHSFRQEGLQWVHQSTYHVQHPAPSLLENTTSKLRAEWETIEDIFFFSFRKWWNVQTG